MMQKAVTRENSSFDRNATKEALLGTAERLYAQRGLDAVSMREITREAGQKNSTALQYHFSSKEALVSAIMVRRMKDGDYRRLEFLHELELRGKLDDLRSLAAALVGRNAAPCLARFDEIRPGCSVVKPCSPGECSLPASGLMP